MDLEKVINKKLENLKNIYDKYNKLIKEHKRYDLKYRVNGILSEIEILEQVLNGETDAKDWLECFKEDEAKI